MNGADSPKPWISAPALLVLQAVRVLGMADDHKVARHTGLDHETVSELLLDHEAHGWVTFVEFADVGGWTLTQHGRAENQRQLAEELAISGSREVVDDVNRRFQPLNDDLVRCCTDWQLRPHPAEGRRIVNDHSDRAWDGRILDELVVLDRELHLLIGDLTAALARLGGYDVAFHEALTRAQAGQDQWVTGVEIPSCHTVWIQLHEDLLSTLGISRDTHEGASHQ